MKALFHPGLFTAHDIWHQVVRFHYFSKAASEGYFPAYWISELAQGYGYPLFIFSYQLPWIIGLLFSNLGFSLENVIKTLFFLSFLGSGIFMYFFAKSFLKDSFAALLSSIIYMWAPYHFLIIFVGASMGIAFIFTFLPLLFLGLNLIRVKSPYGSIIFALGLSGIILSHVMHIIYLSPIILLFIIWSFINVKEKTKYLKTLFLSVTLGFLISAFYLIPAFYYNNSTRVHKEEGVVKLYERNFVDIKQLIYSKWGFSPIVNNAKDEEISLQIGIGQWLSIFTAGLLIVIRRKSLKLSGITFIFLLLILVNIFFMLDYSKTIWKFIINFIFLDYPFRFILPVVFLSSILSGIVFISINNKLRILFFVTILAITIYTNRNYINVNQYTHLPISYYLDTDATTNSFNEYLPINASPSLLKTSNPYIEGDGVSVKNISYKTNSVSINLLSERISSASAGQFYFPGQKLYIDGKQTNVRIDEEGRISFNLTQGVHNVLIKYEESEIINISKTLSIMGLLFMLCNLFYIIKFKKNKL